MSLDAITTAIVGEEWTLPALAAHVAEIRAADNRFHDSMRQANDRRYAEVNVEKEKALKIKETADLAALTLAREIQSYKDINAEKSREQNLRETGQFVTRIDLEVLEEKIVKIIEPLVDYVSGQKGSVIGSQLTTVKLFGYIAAGGTLAGIAFALINYIAR